MTDIEAETLPGVTLGHKNIPCSQFWLLRSGRSVSDGGVSTYVGPTASVAGVPRIIAAAPPVGMVEPSLPLSRRWLWVERMKSMYLAAFRLLVLWLLGPEMIRFICWWPGNAFVAEAASFMVGLVLICLPDRRRPCSHC